VDLFGGEAQGASAGLITCRYSTGGKPAQGGHSLLAKPRAPLGGVRPTSRRSGAGRDEGRASSHINRARRDRQDACCDEVARRTEGKARSDRRPRTPTTDAALLEGGGGGGGDKTRPARASASATRTAGSDSVTRIGRALAARGEARRPRRARRLETRADTTLGPPPDLAGDGAELALVWASGASGRAWPASRPTSSGRCRGGGAVMPRAAYPRQASRERTPTARRIAAIVRDSMWPMALELAETRLSVRGARALLQSRHERRPRLRERARSARLEGAGERARRGTSAKAPRARPSFAAA